MNPEYILLYNDLSKFAVMTLHERNGENLVFIYFSENEKHLSDDGLKKGFNQEVTDKAIKAKLAKQRFLSKFFQSPAKLSPNHIGNVNFKPLKSGKDVEQAISILHELHQTLGLEPPKPDSTLCAIEGLDETKLDALIKFFEEKQKESDTFNHRTFY